MREKILEDLKIALKQQEKLKLSVLRLIKGAMQLEEINLKRELNDEEMLSLLSKQIKMRKESIVEFEKGNRKDLIDQTQAEIEILSNYMPQPLTESEIENIIHNAFIKLNPKSIQDLGVIMKEITPLLKGKVDMRSVTQKIKEKLSLL